MQYSRYSVNLEQAVPLVEASALMTLHSFQEAETRIRQKVGASLGQLAMQHPHQLMEMLMSWVSRDEGLREGEATILQHKDSAGGILQVSSAELGEDVVRALGPPVHSYTPDNARMHFEIVQLPGALSSDRRPITDPKQLDHLFATGEILLTLTTEPPAL